MEFFSPLFTIRHPSQAGRDVPEANVCVLRLQTEIKSLKTDTHHKICFHLHIYKEKMKKDGGRGKSVRERHIMSVTAK